MRPECDETARASWGRHAQGPAASEKGSLHVRDRNLSRDCVHAQGLAGKGQLGKLKVDQLKDYCRAHGLKLTGKKDDLIERISEHVSTSNAQK